jgi:hypothetical protein
VAGDREHVERARVHRFDGARHELAAMPRVRIGEAEYLAARVGRANRAGPRLTEPVWWQLRGFDDANARILRRDRPGDIAGAVARPVVGDDHLERGPGRIERRAHRAFDVPPLVASGDDHRYERSALTRGGRRVGEVA